MPAMIPLEQALVGWTTPGEDLAQFRKWHVEALLNQAADLLDRCLRDRAEYYQLAVSDVLLDLELNDTNAKILLIDKQKADGLFTHQSDLLNTEITRLKESSQDLSNLVITESRIIQ